MSLMMLVALWDLLHMPFAVILCLSFWSLPPYYVCRFTLFVALECMSPIFPLIVFVAVSKLCMFQSLVFCQWQNFLRSTLSINILKFINIHWFLLQANLNQLSSKLFIFIKSSTFVWKRFFSGSVVERKMFPKEINHQMTRKLIRQVNTNFLDIFLTFFCLQQSFFLYKIHFILFLRDM